MKRIGLHRNAILAVGTLAAMGTSCIYMWSIFNKPLMATYGFTASETSMAYSLFLLATCFSSMLAGWLQKRIQPRFIVLVSGLLFGMGWFLSGFAGSLPMLYLFFGGFAGAGNGLLYNTIVAVIMKWFPDKRGFANGICIGAIGLGPVFFAPLGNFLIESFNVQLAFQIVGIIWLVVYLVVSWFLVVPPDGWTPGRAPAAPEQAKETRAENELNFTATQMFRQPLYYALFLVMMVACTSGFRGGDCCCRFGSGKLFGALWLRHAFRPHWAIHGAGYFACGKCGGNAVLHPYGHAVYGIRAGGGCSWSLLRWNHEHRSFYRRRCLWLGELRAELFVRIPRLYGCLVRGADGCSFRFRVDGQLLAGIHDRGRAGRCRRSAGTCLFDAAETLAQSIGCVSLGAHMRRGQTPFSAVQ